jgi:hypothetical protein
MSTIRAKKGKMLDNICIIKHAPPKLTLIILKKVI